MIKTELCELAGITYPIIQAGMGPYCTNNLAIAAANAGALGIIYIHNQPQSLCQTDLG